MARKGAPPRGYRSFAPKYDVPERTSPDIQFNEQTADAGPQPDAREPFVELLLSEGFKELVRHILLPQIKNIRSELLRRADLDDKQRERLVASLRTIETILEQTFKRAGETMPAWLLAQFK